MPYNNDTGRALSIELRSRIQEIARRVIWGQPHTQIMADLGLTYRQLKHVLRHEAFKLVHRELERSLYSKLDKEFSEEMVTVEKKAKEASVDAIETLIALMRVSPSDGLKRDCANDVLKYAGVNREKMAAPALNISQQQINVLVEAAREDDERRIGNSAA